MDEPLEAVQACVHDGARCEDVITRRRVWLGAAIILVLAACTRFVGLGYLELWYDEITTFAGTTHSSWGELLRWEVVGNPEHSPLPFMEIKTAMHLFGPGRWVLRLASACYGVGAILAMYFAVGALVNWRAGCWSAVLLALNPQAIECSRECKMYSPWVFYSIVMVAVAALAVQRVRRGDG